MRLVSRKHARTYLVLEEIMHETVIVVALLIALLLSSRRRRRFARQRRFSLIDNIPNQVTNIRRMVGISDVVCKDQLRMDMSCFRRLCELLGTFGGLTNSRHVSVQEKVAMFLSILAHHNKNAVVKHHFLRSGQTVSKHFHSVLSSVLKLHSLFLVEPTAIPDDCTDNRWKCFKGCLGALEGTYIDCKVSEIDKPRYRNRKGHISVNVLGVCDRDMKFIYVLPGWEGSAADSRVLRDAISRNHGLKIPKGNYYLADNGYPNAEGFLTPYKGVRYHLNEWSARSPQNPQEFFNMKHTRARNVIERTFGLLKMRWGILRSPSFYPIKTHNRIIMACCLLHNFIRKEMDVDPMENDIDDFLSAEQGGDLPDTEMIDIVQTSPEWTTKRDALAIQLFNEWRNQA